MTPKHTIEDFIQAFGLTQKGKEWVGPCPVCKDGEDRFHVREGSDGPVFGCRYCMNEGADPNHENAKQVWALLRGGQNHTNGRQTPENAPQRSPRARQPKPPPEPQQLPTGPNITRYDYTTADGELVFAVIRRDKPDGDKVFSQWIPVAPPGLTIKWENQDVWIEVKANGQWLPVSAPPPKPMYGLPSIGTSGKVAIVEGEKCVAACREAWPSQITVTWAGGTNAWHQTDWTPIAGRVVSLLADGDDPGHKAMQSLALHLSSLGCSIKVALAPTDWDSDVADWIAEGGKAHAGKIIGELLQEYQPPADAPAPEAEPESPPELDETAGESLRQNTYFRILGLQGDDHILIKRVAAGRPWRRTFEQVQQIPTLNALAQETWWQTKLGIDKLDTKYAQLIGRSIMDIADELGQVDESLMFGRGAVKLPDGRIGYHLGDRLLLGGHEYDLDTDTSLVWLAEPRIELGADATMRQTAAIANAVMGYRWATPDDGRRFLGWIVAAMIGGALEWRPHLLLNAPASQGKTWVLKEVLEKLMGPLVTSLSDATPAAISKVREHSSLPIAIDEAEPSEDWVMELLKTLRAASSDFGSRIRVAPGNAGVNFQQARFCALLAGTIAPSLGRADETRLTPVSFGPPVDDWPKVRLAIRTTMQHADAVRYRFIRRAGEIAIEAARLSDEMQDLGMDSREALSSAAITAGWRAWGVDDREVHSQPESNNDTDAGAALLEILAIRHRQTGGKEESLGAMLGDSTNWETLADLYGLRMVGGALCVAHPHAGLQNAMAKTRYANANLRKLLMQLEGAAHSQGQMKFGARLPRAIMIPPETLAAIGVEISE